MKAAPEIRRVALLADVHANRPALLAVLEAIDALEVDRVICAGDLVGYNAEPNECIHLLRAHVHACIAGNHDRGVTEEIKEAGTNATAREVIEWTRGQLDPEALQYLRDLPAKHADASGVLLAHGCFLNDIFYRGYVTSTMVPRNLEAIRTRPEWPKVGACGHTHVPMFAYAHRDQVFEANGKEPIHWPADAQSVLLNPGSVGQPRDGDPRASFATIDMLEGRACIHRVPYDIQASASAIRDAGLPDTLSARLYEGR
ncbi:MAG: metallophosphatase family protein [Myxococcales bacterium]|nr:metallophosphatase family protein [Myxococcales bacterium]